MKPLRIGIVAWMTWQAGDDRWFTDHSFEDDACHCLVCNKPFSALPKVQRPGPPDPFITNWMWGGLIRHALLHVREAHLRRSTIEAIEAVALLAGEGDAASRVLGPRPPRQKSLEAPL